MNPPISKYFGTCILKNKLPEAYVFTYRGKLYNPNILGDIRRKLIQNSELPHINLYNATRRSIASQSVNSWIGLERISKALGHFTLKMTKKYASINVELLRDIADSAQVVHIVKEPSVTNYKI